MRECPCHQRCIAYRDDGTRCREPATILDQQRGGMVCWRHDPERWRRFCWTEDDAEGMTLTQADGTVIPLGAAEAAEVFDTYHCPTHGARRYSRGEVRQAERDETCLYVCTLCGHVADPTPFNAGAEEDPAC